MRKLVTVLVALSLLAGGYTTSVFAAPEGRRGVSDQAMENASDQAVFNRVEDETVTVGESEEEKEDIMVERKAKRDVKKAKARLAKKEEKIAKRKAGKQQKQIQKKSKKTKKNLAE